MGGNEADEVDKSRNSSAANVISVCSSRKVERGISGHGSTVTNSLEKRSRSKERIAS